MALESSNASAFPTERLVNAELRTNLVRVTAIAIFYVIHLWNYVAPQLAPGFAEWAGFSGGVSSSRHLAVTTLCLGWLMMGCLVHFQIAQRTVSDRLALMATLTDILFLTSILCVTSGPQGPLVSGYFLILMMSGLRFNLRLIRLTTGGVVLGYLTVLAVARWPQGLLAVGEVESVPRYHQIMVLTALLVGGVIMGQMVRHGYTIVDELRRGQTEARA